MDSIIIFIIGIVLAVKTNQEIQPRPKVQIRKNPDFIKQEDAFMTLYNRIMKKG